MPAKRAQRGQTQPFSVQRSEKHAPVARLSLPVAVPVDDEECTIKVCVRVRPFVPREKNEKLCVTMPSDYRVVITDEFNRPSIFDFDRAFFSNYDDHARYASQKTLMDELGMQLVENAFSGYNNCLFAYGQTGSGKTHSVVGTLKGDDRGLMPRILEEVFGRMDHLSQDVTDDVSVEFNCKASYMEVYNESIRDLLVKVEDRARQKLEVRHHPVLGVIVPGLLETAVTSWADVMKLIEFGSKTRTMAATSMNAGSSRSHCIFAFTLEQIQTGRGRQSTLRSRVNIVDLAGSERVKKTEAEGERLKEGNMINQSLSVLANVIAMLAEDTKTTAHGFAPFRNSKLTQILQDSLSGNSRTVMLAALSPTLSNLEETRSTLRFAQTCKKVVTRAVKNEQSKEDLIQTLQRELQQLKDTASRKSLAVTEADKIQELELIRASLEKSVQDQLEEAKYLETERQRALEDMGLSMDELANQFKMDRNTPNLVNISDDPSLSGCLIYFLSTNEASTIGSDPKCKIPLQGLAIKSFMCSCFNQGNHVVTMTLLNSFGQKLREDEGRGGRILVNGRAPPVQCELLHMDRLIIGHAFCFKVVVPLQKGTDYGKSRAATKVTREDVGMDDVLAEVVREDAPEWIEVRAMLDSIQDRIGLTRVQEFLIGFTRMFPLVEEVNLITQEVRPLDRLRFQLEVASDIKTFSHDQPELIVRMYREERGGREELLGVMELEDFVDRVDAIREIYDNFKQEGPSAMTTVVGQDPWGVYSFRELQKQMMAIKEKLAHVAESPSALLAIEQVFGTLRKSQRAADLENGNSTNGYLQSFGSPLSPRRTGTKYKGVAPPTIWPSSPLVQMQIQSRMNRSGSAPPTKNVLRTWKP